MAGATFSRLHNWIATEVLKSADVNAEFNNVLNNLDPSGVGAWSTNAAQMQLQTSPGGLGSESLATALSGELQRIRYVIQRMIGNGVTYWYQAPSSTITDLVAALGSGLPQNRIVSGLTTGNSSQLIALQAAGTTSSLTLFGAGTTFSYYVNNTPYSVTANTTITGLSLASASNATCQVSSVGATPVFAGQQWTKALGQYGTNIPVINMGSTVSAQLGSIAAFKTGSEYLIAYVNTTSALTQAWRGSFFNQTPTVVPAVGLNAGDVLTMLKLTWVFVNTGGSLAVTYNNPTIAAAQPTGPATGDYWFDLTTTAWKTFNSTTWVAANAMLAGMCLQDTANCVAARTFDSYQPFSSQNSAAIDRNSGTVAQVNAEFAEVSLFGKTRNFGPTRPSWNLNTNLDTGVSTLDTVYFFYMKETGAPVVSATFPMHRRELRGLYHPGETWRCLGSMATDANTAFVTVARSFAGESGASPTPVLMLPPAAYPGTFQQNDTAQLTDLFPSNYVNVVGSSGTWPFGGGGYGNFATVSLTPGIWAISAVNYASLSSGTIPTTSWSFGIDNLNSTLFANGIYALNMVQINTITGAGQTQWANTLTIPRYLVTANDSIASSFYLKAQMSVTTGATFTTNWRIFCERIDNLNGMPR